MRERPLGARGGASGGNTSLHRAQLRSAPRRQEESRWLDRSPFQSILGRGYDHCRWLDGLWLLPWRTPSRARHKSRYSKRRDEAEARRAISDLFVLRV